MADVDGVYDCVIKSPLGDQQTVLSVTSRGDSFSGTAQTPMGDMTVKDGQVDGNLLTFTMKTGLPMPMTLTGEAIIEGDRLTGSLTAGSFGTMAIIGTRKS